MGAVGSTGSEKVKGLLAKSMGNYDPRFSKDIQSAADEMHKDFPEIMEIIGIKVADGTDVHYNSDPGTIAGVNGVGELIINGKIVENYDKTVDKLGDMKDSGWLSGNGTFKNSILDHELAHNLDSWFGSYMMAHAPETMRPPFEVKTEHSAETFSKVFGKDVKVGDTISNYPVEDNSAKYINFEGKQYSVNDLWGKNGRISDTIVPMAIKNVQDNWKALGYSSKPTEEQLVSHLSGYANWSRDFQNKNYHAEVFAESHSNSKAYGKDANPLAQEVTRLTKGLYKSVASHKKNGVREFKNKISKASGSKW